MGLAAGKLDRRIRIERANTTLDDGSGQEVQTWLLLAEAWASRRRASAREMLAAAELSAEVSDVFECRWSQMLAAVDARDRIVFGGRAYDIKSVDEIGRRVGLRIGAVARGETP